MLLLWIVGSVVVLIITVLRVHDYVRLSSKRERERFILSNDDEARISGSIPEWLERWISKRSDVSELSLEIEQRSGVVAEGRVGGGRPVLWFWLVWRSLSKGLN